MSTAQLLGEYVNALRKWKRMRDVRDENEKAEKPSRLKPLPPIPSPIEFDLKEDDIWTVKTRESVIGKPESRMPVRRIK